MVEIPVTDIMHVLAAVGMGAFAWCWRLQIMVTKLKTIQDVRTDALNKLCEQVDHIDRRIDEIAESVAAMRGYIKGAGPPQQQRA